MTFAYFSVYSQYVHVSVCVCVSVCACVCVCVCERARERAGGGGGACFSLSHCLPFYGILIEVKNALIVAVFYSGEDLLSAFFIFVKIVRHNLKVLHHFHVCYC
jgi:hypothetical protein